MTEPKTKGEETESDGELTAEELDGVSGGLLPLQQTPVLPGIPKPIPKVPSIPQPVIPPGGTVL